MNPNKAIFLDRDGTVIVDKHYLKDPLQVELMPGVGETLQHISAHGYRFAIISNQSGIGRGLLTPDEVEQQHQRLRDLLERYHVDIAHIEYCPHAPEAGCSCRKPMPEMILKTAAQLGVDPALSYMVGDKESDIECGKRAGCQTILLGNDPQSQADYQVGFFSDILALIE